MRNIHWIESFEYRTVPKKKKKKPKITLLGDDKRELGSENAKTVITGMIRHRILVEVIKRDTRALNEQKYSMIKMPERLTPHISG